ncbi:MAG TPA: UDP-2,3-diacylglucosamine diphosphatase [Burkholderiales bacterium]|nr:UDP-2,3-diacylglucosamine diphosphatase [Burkholderiales bacterium]
MQSIFVSDLHLAPERPEATATFREFAAGPAAQAEAVYILGDFFEYWVGDDELDDPFNASLADVLHELGGKTALHFMHGNRDMLAGTRFAERCRAKLLGDSLLLDLYGTKTLVMHGDTLCTDDVAYQKFRAFSRDPNNQRMFLAQPLEARRKQAMGYRADSQREKAGKTDEIMDVAPAAVEQVLRENGYPRLIHGHTHRPGRHVHVVDGKSCERWVLTDWYDGRAGYLVCDASGCRSVTL